jgi:hypothetical protein
MSCIMLYKLTFGMLFRNIELYRMIDSILRAYTRMYNGVNSIFNNIFNLIFNILYFVETCPLVQLA